MDQTERNRVVLEIQALLREQQGSMVVDAIVRYLDVMYDQEKEILVTAPVGELSKHQGSAQMIKRIRSFITQKGNNHGN